MIKCNIFVVVVKLNLNIDVNESHRSRISTYFREKKMQKNCNHSYVYAQAVVPPQPIELS